MTASHRHLARLTLLLIIVALSGRALPMPVEAQAAAACGVVDAIDFPVEILAGPRRGDDFGLYRAKFGGLHTGLDVAFYHYGDPVRAVANGRVTYSDVEGWDTEKGVVIIEHTMPDGEIFYSLYGHMESIDDYFFPGVGQCVTRGRIVGAVGDPSLSAPHLHLEIRDFMPDDGGPGYLETNPLESGWLHPLDFIRLWQLRLMDGKDGAPPPYVSHVTGLHPPAVPPIVTAEGGLVVADGTVLEGVDVDGALLWRMELGTTVAGVVELDDGRLAVRTTDDTIALIRAGRYEAVWTPDRTLTGAPMLIGGALTFFTEDNAVAAYTPEGALLWDTLPLGGRLASLTTTPDRLAIGTRPIVEAATPTFHLIDGRGQMLYQVAPTNPPLAAVGPAGDTYLLDGATLYHIGADFVPAPLARLPYTPGGSTALAADAVGNVYVFLGLDDGYLLAYDAAGGLRWTAVLPGTHPQAPLLAAGRGCLLYALGVDGTLFAVDAISGDVRGQTQLYAGGTNGHPNARVLDVLVGPEGGELVRFGAGFLTVATVDGFALAGLTPATCTAG